MVRLPVLKRLLQKPVRKNLWNSWRQKDTLLNKRLRWNRSFRKRCQTEPTSCKRKRHCSWNPWKTDWFFCLVQKQVKIWRLRNDWNTIPRPLMHSGNRMWQGPTAWHMESQCKNLGHRLHRWWRAVCPWQEQRSGHQWCRHKGAHGGPHRELMMEADCWTPEWATEGACWGAFHWGRGRGGGGNMLYYTLFHSFVLKNTYSSKWINLIYSEPCGEVWFGSQFIWCEIRTMEWIKLVNSFP